MDYAQHSVGADQGTPTIGQFCARAVILLAFGIACMRIAGRRTFSGLSPLDLFIAIVVGSNISRVMTGNVPFVGALLATLLVVVVHRLLAMATLHSNLLALFIKGRSVVLVRDCAPDMQAMRRYDVSDADLIEGLRMCQLARVEDAALVAFERGGKISVIPRNTRSERKVTAR
jgi:uncharacterized membrane protein YcaP (DUF421 family)